MRRILVLLSLLLLAHPGHASDERWYVLMMQGQRAGWMVERERTADGSIESTTESSLTIRRGETSLTISMASRFIETEDGRPIEMSSTTNLGGGETVDRYIFDPDGVRWSSTSNGTTTERVLPRPEGRWLPPAAAARYTAKRLGARAEEITVRTIDPLNGLEPVVTTRSAFEPATIEVLGRTVTALRCSARSDLYPDSIGTEYIDEQGNLLRSEFNLGAMRVSVVAADEQLAKARLDPPELMRSLFVTPDRPIERPYERRSATFVVRAIEGELPRIPETGGQRVVKIDAQSVRLTRSTSESSPPDAAEDREQLTASSAMITCDDPRVIELTDAALTGAPRDPAARAERARRFVHRHIRTKDLSVGFASAAETARTREGDCTEHAVLLAALLRRDGIPARVVSGLIYADRFAGGRDIFGYHMWTQALLPVGPKSEERWVDLDATLPDSIPITATHIALGVHDLAGDSRANALVELAPLMGRLAIQVESVE
jgi:hypothetical protein